MAKARCPRMLCHSMDVSPVGVTKKAGVVKGLIGAAVGGPVLGAAGLMSGRKEATFRCNRCGRVFSVKV